MTTTTHPAPSALAASDHLIDHLRLDSFFDDHDLAFDLTEGVIFNPSRTRVCLLSTDLLKGIYLALLDEAGPAWRIIFKNCGSIWGGRVAWRLERECQQRLGTPLSQLALPAYLGFLHAYFRAHGWGALRVDVAEAPRTGLVAATLVHSVFAEIIDNPEEMVDALPAGLLAGLLGHVSDRALDCVQTTCTTKGAAESRFLVGTPERLRDAEAMVRAGVSHEEILAKL